MKLYFTCPQAKADFATDAYSLEQGHQVEEDEHGGKKLVGMVCLHQGCPLCGQKHRYEVKEVICPISRGKNEE